MSINYAELEKIVYELKDFIIGSICKKITQYNRNALVLEFRKENKEKSLLIYIDAKNTFTGLTSYWYSAPKNPFHFTGAARKYLADSIVSDFYSEKNDRILHIVFNEYRIIAELLGKNGNIFLVDSANKILAVLHNRTGEKRMEKEGALYIAPSSCTQKEFSIRKEFSENDGKLLINKITDFYLKRLALEKLILEKNAVTMQINKKKQYLENLIDELQNTDESIYKETADTILENINNFKSIKDKLKLKPIEGKSASDNAQYFYDIYKKQIRKKTLLNEYIDSVKNKINNLEKKENTIAITIEKVEKDQLNAFRVLQTRESKSDESSLKTLKSKESIKGKSNINISEENSTLYNILKIDNGKKIVYGKSASGNNEILKKFGRGNFWWFHTRDYQGPFVILLNENLTQEDIKIASTFALHFSKGKNSGRASVIYTRCKYVKTIPKILGKVTYTQEKEYFAIDDPLLIKRIIEKNEEI